MALCKNIEKILKVTLSFLHKMKTNTSIKKLRQASLDGIAFYKYTKSGIHTFNIKREINVKKIQVKKSLKNTPSSQNELFSYMLYIIRWRKMQAIF